MTLVAGDHQCHCVCIYLDQAQFPSSEWNLNDPLKGLLEKCWMRCSLIVHMYMYLLLYEWLKGIHNRKKRKFLGLIQLQPQLLRLCRHQKIWLKFVQLIFSHAKANFQQGNCHFVSPAHSFEVELAVLKLYSSMSHRPRQIIYKLLLLFFFLWDEDRLIISKIKYHFHEVRKIWSQPASPSYSFMIYAQLTLVKNIYIYISIISNKAKESMHW